MPAPCDSSVVYTCFTTRETVSAQSVSPPVKRSATWFGRVPAQVGADLSISDSALRVYVLLALQTFNGSMSSIGMRRLGKALSLSPATVMRRIQELEKAGHIKGNKAENGKRAWYELTSPVFAAKSPEKRVKGGSTYSRKSSLSPTVRMARAAAANQAEREREIA